MTLVLVAVVYSTFVFGVGVFLSRVVRLRSPFAWLLFGFVAWVPLLLGAGQHIPLLEEFAPTSYCFGEPGLLHAVSLALPPLAVTLAAALRADPGRESEGAA